MIYVALVGLTLILVRGTIFRSLQNRAPALFGCAQCVGAWVGATAGASGIVPAGHGRILDAVIVGAATSFLATLADAVLLKLLGDPSEKKPEEKEQTP
jgi:hypothetical protein